MRCPQIIVAVYREIWKQRSFFNQKTIKWFPSKLLWRAQQSPVILDLCLSETRRRKSHDYRDVIVFEVLNFQNVFHSH